MTNMKTLAMASIIAIGASSASAAEYSFNLASDGDHAVWNDGSFTITHGDMSATFTGGAFKNPSTDVDDVITSGTVIGGSIGRYYGGAGVYHEERDREHTIDNFNDLDGFNYYSHSYDDKFFDFISVSFAYMGEAVDVALTSLSFGYVTQGSEFGLVDDANGNSSIGIGDQLIEFGSAESTYYFGNAPEGSVFAVVAAGENSSFKLRQVNFGYMPPVNEVPLPAAGWMLLAGVGGLVAAKRRKLS